MGEAAGVLVLPELCVGCRLCEFACAVAGTLRRGRGLAPARARGRGRGREREAPRLPRIVVSRPRNAPRGELGEGGVPWTCRHCERPPCASACVSGALVKDGASGLVYVREDMCVGCGTCVASCPLGAVRLDPLTGKAWKCDGCRELGRRLCEEVCPTGALRGREGPMAEAELQAAARRRRARELGFGRRGERGP